MLSIVLPVHNGEHTLCEAVDSVLAQSDSNWELIIVDDNSVDNSLRMAEKYRKKDNRIRVVSNSVKLGPAAARNRGIDIAKGDYIGFLDCDDTLHKDFVKRMTTTATAYDADVVWCQYVSRSDKDDIGLSVGNEVKTNTILDAKQAVELFFNDTLGIGSICNKIYSYGILSSHGGFRLNPQRVKAEDWEFNLFVFKTLERLVVLDDFLYNYYHRNPESIMSSFRKEDYALMWRSINLLETVNEEMNIGKSFRDIININANSIMEFIYQGITKNMTCPELVGIFRQERFRNWLDNIDIKKFPLTYKLLARLLRMKLYRTVFILFNVKAGCSIRHRLWA